MPIRSTSEALRARGLTGDELSAEQRVALDRDGFCIFELTEAHWHQWGVNLEILREQVDLLQAKEGWRGGLEGKHDFIEQARPLERGAQRLGNLVDKHPVFRRVVLAPPILAASAFVAAEMKFSSLNYRDPAPGTGWQRLHIDWVARQRQSEPYGGCICYLCLDDMDLDNGPIRAVPGSHRILDWPDAHVDVNTAHAEEIRITARAGWLIAANLHLWHGGTDNRDGRRRRVLNTTFRRRDVPQFLNARRFLSTATNADMCDVERYLYAIRDEDPLQAEDNFGPGSSYREWLNKRQRSEDVGSDAT